MITLDPTTQLMAPLADRAEPDEAELAASSFLARYSGRTVAYQFPNGAVVDCLVAITRG